MSDPADQSDVNRRDLLGAVGAAAAGGLLLAGAVTGADAPGNSVADRTGSIKITSVKGIPTGPKAYIKIETNHKITGWGEVTGLEPKVACALAESLFELLDGENPTRVEFLWQKLYRAHRDMRGGPFMVHTIAGIDMALWDIAGKLWGVPVYRLLGKQGLDTDQMPAAGTPILHTIGYYMHAGGHGTMAGGRLHRPAHTDAELQAAYEALVRRFLENAGRPVTPPIPLVDT